MKYLKAREKFISDSKKIFATKINEVAFNDTRFVDTLVGRLFNMIIRKIGVGVNMVRIQPVINRLKLEFRNILSASGVAGIDKETKKKISMLLIYQIIQTITTAIVEMKSPGSDEDDMADISKKQFSDIKPENYLNECEDIIQSCLEAMSSTVDQYGEIDNYDELEKSIREVLEVIKIMKKEVAEENPQKEKEPQKEGESFQPHYNANFTSISEMVLEYDALKKKQAEEFAKKPVAPNTVDPKPDGSKPYDGTTSTSTQKVNFGITKESETYSYINEAAVASPVMAALKKLYDTLKQMSPEDLVRDLTSYIKMSPENKNALKFSGPISKIYKYIRLKSGIKESVSINEDLNLILTKDKVLGDLIMSLYAVSKTKADASFEGISPKMKVSMAAFNLSMVKCLAASEKKNESLLLRYQDFRQIGSLNESKLGDFLKIEDEKMAGFFGYSEEDAKKLTPEEVAKLKVTKANQQGVLSSYWKYGLNTKITKLLISEKEFATLTQELADLQDEPGDGLILSGFDPVIAILKCFNRAYKLYTVSKIGDRSDDKIDRHTYAEYTSFGSSTTISNSNGPFRHNKTFNMWENAVLNILGDREFQPIFDKDTKMQIGNKFKDGAGPILRAFMTDILDGDTLYKSGSGGFGTKEGGTQKALLEKYFGPAEGVKDSQLAFDGIKEIAANAEQQSKIKTCGAKFKTGTNNQIQKPEDLKGMIVKLKTEMTKPQNYKDGDDKEIDTQKRYFFVQEMDGDFLYVVFSRNFGHFRKYVGNDYLSRTQPISVSFEADLVREPESEIFLTKIKLVDFKKMLTPNGKVTLKGQIGGSTNKKDIGEQTTKAVEFLNASEDGKESVYNLQKLVLKGTKGFPPTELKSHSPQSL